MADIGKIGGQSPFFQVNSTNKSGAFLPPYPPEPTKSNFPGFGPIETKTSSSPLNVSSPSPEQDNSPFIQPDLGQKIDLLA